MLLDLAIAKLHLRVDCADDDLLIALYIGAAYDQAQQYLGRNIYADQESMAAAILAGTAGDTPPMVCNDSVLAAMLLTLGHLYANREDVITGASPAAMPMGSRALLAPYRRGMGV